MGTDGPERRPRGQLQAPDFAEVYGNAVHELQELCEVRKLSLHVFPWRPEMGRTGLQRNAIYLVRPDGYVALADHEGRATAITSYLDARKLTPTR